MILVFNWRIHLQLVKQKLQKSFSGPPMKKSKCELIAPQYECPQCSERVPDFQRSVLD